MNTRFLSGVLRDPEPGGGGGTPAAPPPAIDIKSLTDGIVGGIKGLLAELVPKPATPPAPPAPPEPGLEPKPEPGESPDAAKLRRELAAIEKRLADSMKQAADADARRVEAENKRLEAERTQRIKGELGKLGVRAESLDELFRVVGPDIARAEDGELVGPNNTAIDAYLKEYVEKRPYWLPPIPGSGAAAGAPARSGQRPVDLNDIKPGMTPEETARVAAAIAAAARQG